MPHQDVSSPNPAKLTRWQSTSIWWRLAVLLAFLFGAFLYAPRFQEDLYMFTFNGLWLGTALCGFAAARSHALRYRSRSQNNILEALFIVAVCGYLQAFNPDVIPQHLLAPYAVALQAILTGLFCVSIALLYKNVLVQILKPQA